MADPQPVQLSLSDVLKAFSGSLAVILGLISVLYARLNSDIKGHDISLSSGNQEFHEIGQKLATIAAQISSLDDVEDVTSEKVEKIEASVKALNDRLLVLETKYGMTSRGAA